MTQPPEVLTKPDSERLSKVPGGLDSNFCVFDSYDKLVKATLVLIGNAKSEIHLASTYYEPIVGSKLVEKFAQGVRLNVLDGNPSGTSFVERIREVARVDLKRRELFNSLLESPNVRMRRANIQYSFVVVDRIHCGIELLDPLVPSQFNLGVEVNDGALAQKLVELFERIISSAKVD